MQLGVRGGREGAVSPSACPKESLGVAMCEASENFVLSYPKHLLKDLFLFHFTLCRAIFFNHTELCDYVCLKAKSALGWK